MHRLVIDPAIDHLAGRDSSRRFGRGRRISPALPVESRHAELSTSVSAGRHTFLTLVTERRAPPFATEAARQHLHDAMVECGSARPFSLDAVVLLPDPALRLES
jgi:hypothetical protein